MKKLFISTLLMMLLVGCQDVSQDPTDKLSGAAFLSINLSSGKGNTRANTQESGSENESKAGTVTVLLFDENNVCLGMVDFSGTTVGNSNGAGNTAAASDAKSVPAATKKVFVVINNYGAGWDLSDGTVKGKPWTQINAMISGVATTNIATNQQFMMTSAGSLVDGALTNVTVVKPASKEQADIDAAKATAKTNAVTINIDRLAAKVDVTVNANIEKPTGANFEFVGWELNVTNKTAKLYSDLVPYNNATTTATKGIYRQDGNFTLAEQPADETAMKAAFNYLANEPLSDITRTSGTAAYCIENTMAADAQKLGFTTKIVVKAKFTPKDIVANSSYFMWNGSAFTLDALKAAYATHSAGTGLKVDLPKFLKKAGIYGDGETTPMDTFVAALTAAQFNATSGIKGRYEPVRYYHESVCYYDVLIFHDQSVVNDMELGRYGVVRNNWYSISVDKVSNPGTPWIPDPSDPDPSNPIDPDTDDDKGNAYLSVNITINPWTFWTQSAELN